MVSNLILDFPDTKNVKTLRVSDSSFYNAKITVECGTLEITAPGATKAIVFNVDKGFSLVLNSSNLKLKKVRVFSDLTPLPDGVYKVKYSIKPNEDLWIQYDVLRVDFILNQLYTEMCTVKLQACVPDRQTEEKIKRLREIRTFIDYAKVEVEECHNRKRGTELYDYAQKLLNKYKSSDCLTCK